MELQMAEDTRNTEEWFTERQKKGAENATLTSRARSTALVKK